MRFPTPVVIEWFADFLSAQLIGNAHGIATGINEIHKVEPGDLVFVDHPKYYQQCLNSAASFIIIDKPIEVPSNKTLLVVSQPFEAYLKIVQHFKPFQHATTSISNTATIGHHTYIAPHAFIGHHVHIGHHCHIHPGVVILDHCIIGNDVIIQSGTVIGSDAFYYNTKKDRPVWYKKMESCGRVVIEDFVEIGAGCTIDRGVTHDTRIGQGTKIDNQVHIGHDTVLGKNCLLAAQVGIAGGVTVEDGVTLWGQVGVNKTITIHQNAVVMGQSGVVSSIAGNKVYWGTPAEDFSIKKRELVWIKRIPALWKKIME
jgi:UDP-3-O-[3-hydroxymyristoyl] glucosamine N-acyltransferase